MGRGGGPGRGQRPKPIAKHVADGTYRPDRHGPVEESPELTSGTLGLAVRMPAGLSARMQTAWKTIIRDLEMNALLDRADAGVIEQAATNWGLARDARAYLLKHGLMVARVNGDLIENPAARTMHRAWAQFNQAANQLSLSPDARQRLGLALARGRRAGTDVPGHRAAGGGIGESPRARLRAVTDDVS